MEAIANGVEAIAMKDKPTEDSATLLESASRPVLSLSAFGLFSGLHLGRQEARAIFSAVPLCRTLR